MPGTTGFFQAGQDVMNESVDSIYLSEDTICAPFTPPGRGAMSAIRLSGPEAFPITDSVFHPTGHGPFEDRQLHIGELKSGNELIDKPLAARFPAPNSFTGEDVVEFHVHGSPFVVQSVLEILVNTGAREALPGEFSFRAYINGRMDLTQAEGLSDLINSRTHAQHRAAISHLAGGLKERISGLRAGLLKVLAGIEVTFDHPGEALEAESMEPLPLIIDFCDELDELIATYERGRLVREGFRLGIFGRPNVGKSSLLNRLVGRTRAIVTDEPGTTRDVIEAPIEIGGIEMKIIDTAGLRLDASGIEAIGQDMAREEMRGADIKLLMLDGSEQLTRDDREVFADASNGNSIVALNKSDLPHRIDADKFNDLIGDLPVIRMSCKTGEGIDELLDTIKRLLISGDESPVDVIITASRHHTALVSAKEMTQRASDVLREGTPMDIAALELRAAIEKLQVITGGDFSEDLYSTIFAGFCLGK